MSNTKEFVGDTKEERRGMYRPGATPLTTPSVGKGAKNLDPDLNPWERQPRESKAAYDAFRGFLEDDNRVIGSKQNLNWSGYWSWGYRAYEYDLFLYRQDQEAMLRYRRRMNDRQRRTAAYAQTKVIEWLNQLDASKLTASEAARWLEVAVRIERLAGGDASERIQIGAQGALENMTAEEVNEALTGLMAEIQKTVGG